jgi:hypothetical protein
MTLNCEILFFGEVGDQEKLEFCNGETVRGLVKLTLAEKTLIKSEFLCCFNCSDIDAIFCDFFL